MTCDWSDCDRDHEYREWPNGSRRVPPNLYCAQHAATTLDTTERVPQGS